MFDSHPINFTREFNAVQVFFIPNTGEAPLNFGVTGEKIGIALDSHSQLVLHDVLQQQRLVGSESEVQCSHFLNGVSVGFHYVL